MNEWTNSNPRDLLKVLLDWSRANIDAEWSENDIKDEFQEYIDVIEKHLNERGER